MPTNVRFLQAEHGDAILISHTTATGTFTILVDGGPRTAFRNNSAKRDGNLKKELERLLKEGTLIDLLILTHIDSDHIGGLLEAFKDPNYLPKLVKKVWFNSANSVASALSLESDKTHLINDDFSISRLTSIQEGITFEGLLKKYGIWDEALIDSSLQTNLTNQLKVKVLSPCRSKLQELIRKWRPFSDNQNLLTSGCKHDYSGSYKSLLASDTFEEDRSPTNGSSISLLLTISGRNILLLGDCHPSTIVASLRNLGYDETHPLACELVKVSHHGSKKNTSPELLKLLTAKSFVILTDGSSHCLPNKLTLARIHNEHPKSEILFNYPSLIKIIYTNDERRALENTIGSVKEVIEIAD